MNILVIGAGYWGPNVVRNLVRFSEVERIGVFDLDEKRSSALVFQFPRTVLELDLRKALGSGYHAAVIVTPVLTHADLARQVLEAGLHVLIEKPITHTVADARALIELAEKRDLRLMVGHVFHYKPAVRFMADMVKRGDIGNVCYIDSTRVNLGLFRHDVNVLWDLAPHDLSIFEAVLGGRQPERVFAHGAQHVPHPSRRQETMAYLALDYGQEMMAHLHVNWFSPLKQRQMVIAGDKRMIVYNDMDLNEPLRIYDCGTYDPAQDTPAYPQIRSGDVQIPYVSQHEPLYMQLQEFFSAIREHRAPETDGYSGLRIVRILEAAMESLAEKSEAFISLGD